MDTEPIRSLRTDGDRPQLSLGELIEKLERVEDKSLSVTFDFCYLPVSGLNSWRGDYAELAVGYTEYGLVGLTVEAFLTECKAAVGKRFEGYKGGTYLMDTDTPIWVANWGDSSDTCVVDLRITQYGNVQLVTDDCHY